MSRLRRLLCPLLGGHFWGEWREVAWVNDTMTDTGYSGPHYAYSGKDYSRFCGFCAKWQPWSYSQRTGATR